MQKYAPVAQRIERQPPELKAAGSNPAGRTKIKRALSRLRAPLIFWGNHGFTIKKVFKTQVTFWYLA